MSLTTLPLLLASASPRRRQILSLPGLPYTVCISPVDEEAMQERYQGPIEGLAQWLAEHKAIEALTLTEAADHLVITADTTVLLDGKVLGKPRDRDHARELLLSLRNRWHHVVTGVAVCRLSDGKPEIYSASCTTPVLMRPYSEEEIAAYIATGDPLDKAGAYGIQHSDFQPTERINGCYLNVVGLPLCILVDLLARFDVQPAEEGHKGTGCRWSAWCNVYDREGTAAV
jgi:septum formation protein